MNFTYENLENMTFGKAFMGYNMKQVDNAILRIIADYKKMADELTELKCCNTVLCETVEHYKTIEESMQHCLIIAHHTGDEIITTASDKAKTIVREAELSAEKIVSNAQQEIISMKSAYEEAKAKIYTFKMQTEGLLNAQLDVLKQLLRD